MSNRRTHLTLPTHNMIIICIMFTLFSVHHSFWMNSFTEKYEGKTIFLQAFWYYVPSLKAGLLPYVGVQWGITKSKSMFNLQSIEKSRIYTINPLCLFSGHTNLKGRWINWNIYILWMTYGGGTQNRKEMKMLSKKWKFWSLLAKIECNEWRPYVRSHVQQS